MLAIYSYNKGAGVAKIANSFAESLSHDPKITNRLRSDFGVQYARAIGIVRL